MRHCQTWISKYREDQKDITSLCLFMAFLLAFHLVMREFMVFSIVTLRIPFRLTTVNESMPYSVLNGFILIACLILACSLAHLAGAIGKRMAIKMISASLVISSCCLIANGMILRSILKSVDPLIIANLDPQTVIIDVDRRGWISLDNVYLNKSLMSKILERRFKQCSSTPIIICPERKSPCSKVWLMVDACHAAGATDISLAEESGFDRFKVPAFNDKTIPSDGEADTVTTVLVQRDYFELNGRREYLKEMNRVMSDYVKRQAGHWYNIKISDNAPYAAVTILLHAFQDYGATNVAWESLQ